MSFVTERAAPRLDNAKKSNRVAFIARAVGSAAALVIFFLAITWAARSGVISLLTVYAAKANQVAAANAALSLNASDPDAHFVRGAMLEAKADLGTAIVDYKQAIGARPNDYVLWLALARAQESNDDIAGAIASARQSVRLAPYYARPHWLLGNILVKAGQTDEGFRELRLAGASDDALLAAIIDLGWQLSGGDTDFVRRAVDPKSPESYKALADYFKKRDKVTDAIEMLRAAGPAAEQERRQYLKELVSARTIKEAALLWSIDNPAPMVDHLIDPGFEHESNLDQSGFGWRRENKEAALSLSLDPKSPNEGRFSLRVDFNGNSETQTPIISQFLLVTPGTRYRLHFVARTDGIVSGALPYVGIVDVSNNILLGRSSAFPTMRTDWQEYLIDFKSGDNSSAVQVLLRREPCGQLTCPIFGHLWLDNFSIARF
jgi:tetratricopeptide (TPR) repeat protein